MNLLAEPRVGPVLTLGSAFSISVVGQARALSGVNGVSTTMVQQIPMTQENYDKQMAEVEHLEKVVMREIAEKIAEARAEGDLKENAEYHAQRERQGQMKAKIDMMKDKLARARIVDPSELPDDAVVFGCRVRVKDLDSGDLEVWELVGPGDEDYDNNKILSTSPYGQAMLGKKIGEVAEVQVPRGVLRFEIVELNPGK